MAQAQYFSMMTDGQKDCPVTPDCELLRRYAEHDDESAFTEVVRRHLTLVYASAVRMLNGDAALAQDVTQGVFTDLAYKASTLAGYTTLAGWLHTSVRYAAAKAVRSEERRRNHEQQASIMNNHPTTDTSWLLLRPLLDDAVGQLSEDERNAVLLRFFEVKSHREVGDALGLNENAARMRVERAVEKLRDYFAEHGVTTTAAMLTTTLSMQAASMIPFEPLVTSVAGNSLAKVALAKALTTAATGTLAASFVQKALLTLAGSAVVVGVVLLMVAQFNSTTPPASKTSPASPAKVDNVSSSPSSANVVDAVATPEVNSSVASEPDSTSAADGASTGANPLGFTISALPNAKLSEPLSEDAERHMFIISQMGNVEASLVSFRHLTVADQQYDFITMHIWSENNKGRIIQVKGSLNAIDEEDVNKFSPADQEYIKNWVLQHATPDAAE